MKQEYIDLLRKDIAARLPYEPIVTNERFDGGFGHRLHLGDLATSKYFDSIYIEDTKVYLRSMSSMTEEERKEYCQTSAFPFSVHKYDWLNAHHFDYRGLIERGLAIEVTKENNPYVHRTYADMMKAKEKQ
jgi:hypothetical protein